MLALPLFLVENDDRFDRRNHVWRRRSHPRTPRRAPRDVAFVPDNRRVVAPADVARDVREVGRDRLLAAAVLVQRDVQAEPPARRGPAEDVGKPGAAEAEVVLVSAAVVDAVAVRQAHVVGRRRDGEVELARREQGGIGGVAEAQVVGVKGGAHSATLGATKSSLRLQHRTDVRGGGGGTSGQSRGIHTGRYTSPAPDRQAGHHRPVDTSKTGVYPVCMAKRKQPAFRFEDLQRLYRGWNGAGQPYEHISEILDCAKELHKEAWHAKNNGNGDHGQSWRAWKGKNFEKLVQSIVEYEIENLNQTSGLGLAITTDTTLERGNLDRELDLVKRNLLVDYGVYGCHLPDADLVIYQRASKHVVCILSCKVTMRERIAQTAYWKLKLGTSDVTRHVRVALVTPDEDRDLTNRPSRGHIKKNYAIASVDIDTTYVLNEELQPTRNIKHFSSFGDDLRSWLGGGGGGVDVRSPLPPCAACRGAVPDAA